MKKMFFIVPVITWVFLLRGCFPDSPENTQVWDAVLTFHDQHYNFSTGSTYAMPDSLVKITWEDKMDFRGPVFVPDETARKVLTIIANNMHDLGWQRVEVFNNPDLLLLPAVWETGSYLTSFDYFFSWWYGIRYWNEDYYFPIWEGFYTAGTLQMALVDPKRLYDKYVIQKWAAAINGLLAGSYGENRVSTAINKAFEISPYLRTYR